MKNMMMYALLIATLLAVGCKPQQVSSNTDSVKKPSKTAATVSFVQGQTLDNILTIAKKQNKPVFIDFYIERCAPCILMDETAFTHDLVYDFYNQNFINFKVDALHFDYYELAAQFNVREYPTLVYLDADGNILKTHNGVASAKKLLELGQEVINLSSAL